MLLKKYKKSPDTEEEISAQNNEDTTLDGVRIEFQSPHVIKGTY